MDSGAHNHMTKKIILALISLLSLIMCFEVTLADTKKRSEPYFSGITLTSSNSHLLLYSTLDNGFTEQMVEGLHSGIPIHFSFFVELNQTDKGWKDEKMVSLEISHVISYDTLKESYKVEIEESGKRFHSFDKLADAQGVANEINGLKVTELINLNPNTSYTVRMRAELSKKKLPMGLHEVVPFVSLWDLKTKWYSITFNI